MTAEKNLLFVIPECAKCNAAKDMLFLKGIEFEEINVSTVDGMKLAEKYGIGRVPALLVFNKKGEIIDSVRGIDEINGFFSG